MSKCGVELCTGTATAATADDDDARSKVMAFINTVHYIRVIIIVTSLLINYDFHVSIKMMCFDEVI